ncbi:unnamed protein product [Miscanthus lutarioriparius]|uniref:DUF659 domain-containing protein n=1 Tax=Miscanthus lutarioriparius TaxID=422564 RepID=A0A811RYZ9_9POAL|nr:unnamed protein product [Miscanthus lutarioriparius]
MGTLWFMECGVAFNAANSRQFEIACEAIAQYGSGTSLQLTKALGDPLLQECVKEKIEDIVRDNVVQVVTDNGANYKAAGKILMDRIPTLFWSPCAAHCLDLMLEEIGNLKAFKKPIARAKRVTNFIYRHGRLLSAMRAQTGGTDLVRTAKTRFATSFLTLKSLYKNKDALKSLFVSEAWIGNNLCTICSRAVDGDEKPAMPEVWALMNHAKERIKQSFNIPTKDGLLKIMEIIERRCVKQMDHPLYGAALYLNPGKFFPLIKANDDVTVGQLRGCFIEVLGRMIPDVETQMKINRQAIEYEEQHGEAFSNKMAKESYDKMNPLDWWRSYGGRAIELQRLAKRIVSLCASSSGCERCWSTFSHFASRGMDATWEKSFWKGKKGTWAPELGTNQVIVSIVGLLLFGKVLEPSWGAKELLKFIFIVNLSTSACVFVTTIVLYYITQEESYLYTPVSGFYGVLSGLLVGIKQILPDQELNLFVLKISAKWIPSIIAFISVAVSFFIKESMSYLPIIVFGIYMSWIYLRYFQRRLEVGLKGDPSDEFSFSSFYPGFLRPILDPIASIFHKLFCGRSARPEGTG